MIVLILFIVAATIFGLVAIYDAAPPRGNWAGAVTCIGLGVIAVALAFWHQQGR